MKTDLAWLWLPTHPNLLLLHLHLRRMILILRNHYLHLRLFVSLSRIVEENKSLQSEALSESSLLATSEAASLPAPPNSDPSDDSLEPSS